MPDIIVPPSPPKIAKKPTRPAKKRSVARPPLWNERGPTAKHVLAGKME